MMPKHPRTSTVLAALAMLSAPLGAEELLRNGDIEAPGDGVPAGFAMWGPEQFKKAENFRRDSERPHGGSACLRLHHPADTRGYLLTDPFGNGLRPAPGTVYTISFWARSDKPGRTPQFSVCGMRELKPLTSGLVNNATFPLEVGTDWKRYEFRVAEGTHFTVAGAPYLSLGFYPSTDQKEERTLWIDDLAVAASTADVDTPRSEVAARFPAKVVGQPFAAGAVVACIGDSITHNGQWPRYLHRFYATRYPERHVTFWNAGISGNVSRDVLARLDSDILVRKPTAAVVMLGMNDVNGPNYAADATPASLAPAVDQVLATWRADYGSILARLKDAQVAVTVMTPPPYDQDSQSGGPAKIGKNAALARLSGELPTVAAGLPVIEHYGILQHLAEAKQAEYPAFSFSPDRTHPNEAGHLVIAWAILRAQGAVPTVSRLAIDAASRKAVAERAEVGAVTATAREVSFTVTAAALPYPIDWRAALGDRLVPFSDEFCREELRVAGLAAGDWTLAIDGVTVGTWPAAVLATGIDLGRTVATPQYQQALAVAALVDRRADQENNLRNVVFLDADMRADKVDPEDPVACKAWLDKVWNWRRGIVPSYRETKPKVAEVTAAVVDLDGQIRQAAQPKARRYVLTPATH